MAVVWEATVEALMDNEDKTVAMAHLVWDAAVGSFAVRLVYSLGGPIHAAKGDRFQLSPSVTVGSEAAAVVLGYVPVDVFWFEVLRP